MVQVERDLLILERVVLNTYLEIIAWFVMVRRG